MLRNVSLEDPFLGGPSLSSNFLKFPVDPYQAYWLAPSFLFSPAPFDARCKCRVQHWCESECSHAAHFIFSKARDIQTRSYAYDKGPQIFARTISYQSILPCFFSTSPFNLSILLRLLCARVMQRYITALFFLLPTPNTLG